jgi:hypothetical protein
MVQALRIAAWNANGLQQTIHEIEVFLWDQKIDMPDLGNTPDKRISFKNK